MIEHHADLNLLFGSRYLNETNPNGFLDTTWNAKVAFIFRQLSKYISLWESGVNSCH